MFLEDKIWFPPINVIYHFHRLTQLAKLVPETKEYQKAYEAFITAVSLVGYSRFSGQQCWLQLVDDKEQSPDIRTGYYEKIKRDNDFSIQDVEVVTYEEHSSESLIDFLLRTKLASSRAYDDKTTILCHVKKPTLLPPWNELNKALINKKTKPSVIIIGKSKSDQEEYTMARISPTVDLITTFNLIEECKKLKPSKTLKMQRSANGSLTFTPNNLEKHYPFEKIGATYS